MIEISKKAMQRWNLIPADVQPKLLLNVYCSNCKDSVKIIDFKATISKHDDLLLKGKCSVCLNEVARLIEAN